MTPPKDTESLYGKKVILFYVYKGHEIRQILPYDLSFI